MRLRLVHRVTHLTAAAVLFFTPVPVLIAQRAFAVVDVNVVPMDSERVLAHQTVLVNDGHITAIGNVRDVSVPANALVVTGTNQYLLPGLADMHVHFGGDADELLLYLANGVTTVRELSGEPPYLQWRREVEGGTRVGPRMYIATPIIDASTGRRATVWMLVGSFVLGVLALVIFHVAMRTRGMRVGRAAQAIFALIAIVGGYGIMRRVVPFPDGLIPAGVVAHWWIGTPHEATAVVRGAVGRYDQVKLYENLSPAEFSAAVSAARAGGLHTVAHVPFSMGFERTLHSGLDELAHVYFLVVELQRRTAGRPQALDSVMHAIVAEVRAAKIDVTSTLMPMPEVFQRFTDTTAFNARNDLRYRTPAARQKLREQMRLSHRRDEIDDVAMHVRWGSIAARELVRAGVPLVFGTDDSPFTSVAGFGAHQELAMLRASGLSPYEVLRTATVNASRIVRASNHWGVIRVGEAADFLLVDANPLEDLASLEHARGVMSAGRWYPRPVLDSLLASVVARRADPSSQK